MILKRIKEIVDSYPNNIAYSIDNKKITYKQLWDKASYYANFLKRQGDKTVIIYGNKSINTFISIIACLIAHRVYVPVNDSIPKKRLKQIIKLSNSELVLSEDYIKGINSYKLDDLVSYKDCDIICNKNNYAYIIFTSGSTGVPKGVPISYLNLENFVNWISSLKPLCDYKNISVLNQANFSFDLSVADIYYSLCNGHTLVALDNKIDDYHYIFETLKSVDVMVITPTFIKMCLTNIEFNCMNYSRLKCIYFCGELLDKNVVKKLFDRFTNLEIINAYGPTEATSAVCAVNITKDMLDLEILPVGIISRAATNIKIEDKEIILQGKSVFSGYLNNIKGGYYKENGIDCYKTHDIGYIKDGKLYCRGRIDNQIKYKGYRIEIEDIENNIKMINKVNDCIVVPIYKNNIVTSIKAYVTLTENIDSDYIKKELEQLIPKYMMPRTILIIENMPLNDNGKVDRKRLINYD